MYLFTTFISPKLRYTLALLLLSDCAGLICPLGGTVLSTSIGSSLRCGLTNASDETVLQ